MLILERYQEAIASLDKALYYEPDDYVAWCMRGNALNSLEQYNEAIASYDQALRYKVDDFRAWRNRGLALRKLERYDEAIDSYNKALAINPSDEFSQAVRREAIAALNNPDRKSPTSAG